MQPTYEREYHRLEERHWWFQGRRDAILRLVRRLQIPRTAAVLELGCSGGPLLLELRERGFIDLTGIDISRKAIGLCRERGLARVSVMDAGRLAFPDACFDLLIASDVLEHIEDDAAALRDWTRVLRPGGMAIVFVPAYRWLWSHHDESNRHYRRYTLGELCRRIEASGLQVASRSYWNFALLPPIALYRGLERVRRGPSAEPPSQLRDGSRLVNRLLATLLRTENRLLSRLHYPWGVSAMAIAAKPAGLPPPTQPKA